MNFSQRVFSVLEIQIIKFVNFQINEVIFYIFYNSNQIYQPQLFDCQCAFCFIFYFKFFDIEQIAEMYEQQSETYQLTITIKQIKLAVKFPCKLTLNYQNKTIKSDVSVNENGKYIIDRQLKARSENSQPIEILVHLTTQKGGNIMAGIIKINPKDAVHSEGQVISANLQKCLDQSANCLLKIQRVTTIRTSKAKSMMGEMNIKNRKSFGQDILGSVTKITPAIVDNYRNIQTRSEYQGFNLKKPVGFRKQGNNFDGLGQQQQGNKLYGLGPKSYVPEMAKQKNLDRSADFRKQGKFQLNDDNKTAVGKREVDPSYRLIVQANEKNLKMDIMKYKLKSQQHQKTIQQKNRQMKQLRQQIAQLHRQSVQKGFYQQQINSKNQLIQKYQDQLKQCNKQNTRLQSKLIQMQRVLDQMKNNLQSTVQRSKDEKQRRQIEFNKQLNLKKQQISLLGDEVKNKNMQITRIKKIIDDLEKSLEVKTFDYQRAIQSERVEMSKLQSLLNEKIKQLEEMNRSSVIEKDTLQLQLKKKSQQLIKLQSTTNHLTAQIKQLTQLQRYYADYKQKFIELEKTYEKLEEENKQVQKHYMKLMETKEKDYGEFKQEQSGLLGTYKRKNNQLMDKVKQQTARVLELENRIGVLTADLEKSKRQLQLSQKELTVSQQLSKTLTNSIKQKDQQLLFKQKQLSQLQSKLSTRQSLMKKDIEYKTQQLSKSTVKLAQYEHLYRQQKQTNQTLRFQSTKLQGKNKLQEQIIIRINKQIDQLKSLHDKHQLEYKQQLKQMQGKIKHHQIQQKKLNKQLTDCEIADLNKSNEINRLSKQVDIKNEKVDRLVKKVQEQELLVKELSEEKAKVEERVANVERELKDIVNNKKALEADFTKTEKIRTIIVEQKASFQNELIQLKKDLQAKTNQQQKLNSDINQLKDQLAKMTTKANNAIKQHQLFKQNLYTTIQNSLYASNGNSIINRSFNFGSINGDSIAMIKDSSLSKAHRKYTSTSNLNDNNSSIMMRGVGVSKKLSQTDIMNNSPTMQDQPRSFSYQPRFNQIIESYGRQSQQIIVQLTDSVRKYKCDIERLQKQISSLSTKFNSKQQQYIRNIADLQNTIQQLGGKSQQSSTKWQQKILVTERLNRQKEHVIEELNDQLQKLHHQLAATTRTYQIQLEQLALKMEQFKTKIHDLQAKNDHASMTILNYQEKVFGLESTLSQMSEQLVYEKERVQRKDKLITQHSAKIQQLTKLVQQLKRDRIQLSKQLSTTQERLQAEKENNLKHKTLLIQEEEKNKEIKGFNNNLLKEKQSIVKNQLMKNEKVMQLEDIISKFKMEKEDALIQSEAKSKTLTQQKAQIKKLAQILKQNEEKFEVFQIQVQKLNEAIKEKEKRIQEKQLQIKNLEINVQKLITKYDHDTKKINQEHEETVNKFRKQLQEKQTRILQLSSQVQKLSHLEKKLSQQNINLEEQIFFERQTNSLSGLKFESMDREIEESQSKLSRAIREIENLNEEIRSRQEKLFQMSNKIYAQESKMQMKDVEMRQKLQKLDSDWRNKFEQTLEDYEAKFESIEKEKYYLRTKIDEETQEILKLQNDKRNLIFEEEKEKKLFEQKIKKVENERLNLLVQKNKEIERLRQEIEAVQDKVKESKHEKSMKEEEIRRLEEKVRERDERLAGQDEKARQEMHKLQKELQFQKKKESHLNQYKEFIKNNMWSSERQIKRILQSYIKNIMLLCDQQKKKDIMEIMKTIEGQIVKAVEFNLQEA